MASSVEKISNLRRPEATWPHRLPARDDGRTRNSGRRILVRVLTDLGRGLEPGKSGLSRLDQIRGCQAEFAKPTNSGFAR